MIIRRAGGSAGFVALLLVGCASSPPTHHYALAATALPAAPTPGAPPSVVITAVTVPAEVDSLLIVVEVGGNERRPLDQPRWSAPLDRGLGEVLAADLAVALGGAHVTYRPGNGAGVPDYRVSVDVGGFESRLGSAAVIDAEWTVRPVGDGTLLRGHTRSSQVPADGSIGALVAAHSRAAAALAADIAAAIGRTSH